jgi:hypothetical protein
MTKTLGQLARARKTAAARRERDRAKITRILTVEMAREWAASSERYCFVIDLLDRADVANSYAAWTETRLAEIDRANPRKLAELRMLADWQLTKLGHDPATITAMCLEADEKV